MPVAKAKALNLSFEQADIDRFLAKVGRQDKKTGCWPWVGGKDRKGYGQFWFAGQSRPAPRVSYLFFRGNIPARRETHHTEECLNPSCVNPWHVDIVTKSFNTAESNHRNGFRGNGHVRP